MNLHQLAASLRALGTLVAIRKGPLYDMQFAAWRGPCRHTLAASELCLRGTDTDDARCAPGDGLWNRCY